jgi:hypothetical protein
MCFDVKENFSHAHHFSLAMDRYTILNTISLYKLSKSDAKSEVNFVGMFRVLVGTRETKAVILKAYWHVQS